jgi:hypothetical protein
MQIVASWNVQISSWFWPAKPDDQAARCSTPAAVRFLPGY